MFDFIKIGIKEANIKEILNNPLLSFVSSLVLDTGELKKGLKIAIYRKLKFKVINDQYLYIEGSVHKYFNENGQNGNDFNYFDFLTVLEELHEIINHNPYLIKIDNLEFGVNLINPPFGPDSLISSLINYKGKKFSEMDISHGNGVKCNLNQYRLKIYNKGKQYFLPDKVLRYELSYKKMQELNKIGLYSLGDLLDNEVIQRLRKILERSLNEEFIFDSRIYSLGLGKTIEKEFSRYDNPKYYEKLKSKRFCNERTKVRRSFKKYLGETLPDQLKKLVLEKWDILSALDQISLAKLTGLKEKFLSELEGKSLVKLTKSPIIQYSQINPSYSKSIVFCSESLYGKKAKKCRNKESNPKNVFINKYERLISTPSLFDIKTLLKTNREKIKKYIG